jgi:DNA-binding MarR family transcriptional regulator
MNAVNESERLLHLAQTCAGINLRRATRAINHYYDGRLLEACDLRNTQIPLLVVLYLAGPLTINEMAERLDLDRTTLSRNLKPLQERRLIIVASGRDQRSHVVTLTPQGGEALLKALPVWEEVQANMVRGLGEDRFQTLLTGLAALSKLADEA